MKAAVVTLTIIALFVVGVIGYQVGATASKDNQKVTETETVHLTSTRIDTTTQTVTEPLTTRITTTATISAPPSTKIVTTTATTSLRETITTVIVSAETTTVTLTHVSTLTYTSTSTTETTSTTEAPTTITTTSSTSTMTETGSKILINEVELNPSGPDPGNEWVGLYNPNPFVVDIGGYVLSTDCSGVTRSIPSGTVIGSEGFYAVSVRLGYYTEWLCNKQEVVVLKNALGTEIDRTSVLTDNSDDIRTWQRIPNGMDTDSASDWQFAEATKGSINYLSSP